MTRIQLRRGTGEQWREVNPVLSSGEPGYETDTGRQKIGDGTRAWRSLPYFLDEDVQLRRAATVNEAALGRWWAMCALSSTESVRAVFLGSSTSSGAGASAPQRRWVNRWMRHLQLAHPGGSQGAVQSLSGGLDAPPTEPGLHGFNGANAASNSRTYCSAIHRYAITVLDPVLVVHMIGSNDSVPGDYFVSVDDYKRNVEAAIDSMQSHRCHLLVHSFRRFSTSVTVKEWAAYGDALRQIASSRRNVAFVDLSGDFEEAQRDGDPAGVISSDNVHPSDSGHALLADATSRRLGLGTIGGDRPSAPRDTGWRTMALPAGFTLAAEAGSHALRRVGERVSVRFRLEADATLTGVEMGERLALMDLPDGFAAPGRECVGTGYVLQPLRPAAVGTLSSRSTVSLEVLTGPTAQTWSAGDRVTGQVEWVTDSAWPSVLPGEPA